MWFKFQQWLANTYVRISGVFFDWRSDRLIKKHGGAANVPQEELGELLGPISTQGLKQIKLAGNLDRLADILHKDYTDWKVGCAVIRKLNNACIDAAEDKLISDLANAKQPRKALVDMLLEQGDIQEHQLEYYANDFTAWYNGVGV